MKTSPLLHKSVEVMAYNCGDYHSYEQAAEEGALYNLLSIPELNYTALADAKQVAYGTCKMLGWTDDLCLLVLHDGKTHDAELVLEDLAKDL